MTKTFPNIFIPANISMAKSFINKIQIGFIVQVHFLKNTSND